MLRMNLILALVLCPEVRCFVVDTLSSDPPLQDNKNCRESPQILRKGCSLKTINFMLIEKTKKGDTDKIKSSLARIID